MTTQDKINKVKAMLSLLKDIEANEGVISDCNKRLDRYPEDTIALNWRDNARLRVDVANMNYEQILNQLTEEKESVL